MATQHRADVPDPVDEELARLLADPEIRRSLEDSTARFARGETRLIDHAEARRIVGLPPLEVSAVEAPEPPGIEPFGLV
jgi:hypothetical protein